MSDKPKGKLTVSAANAVNQLLGYLGVAERPAKHPAGRAPVDSEHAREAAAHLADLAHNGLMAGLDGADVRLTWPQVHATFGATAGAGPTDAVLDAQTCGARHPRHPSVRCTIHMDRHPRSWHGDPPAGADPQLNGGENVWAVDAFGSKVKPKPPIGDGAAAYQNRRR